MSKPDYFRIGCCLGILAGTVLVWAGIIWGLVHIFR